MTLVIINAEIDLSVASIMGLSAAAFRLPRQCRLGRWLAILVCLAAGLAAGLVNAIAHRSRPASPRLSSPSPC
jgi:rhamnose transport system permease protein